jgi:hypothetical protein
MLTNVLLQRKVFLGRTRYDISDVEVPGYGIVFGV